MSKLLAVIALILLSACAKKSNSNASGLVAALKAIPDEQCSFFTDGGTSSPTVLFRFQGASNTSKAFAFDCGFRDNGKRCFYYVNTLVTTQTEVVCE
jgi:hypothetical protein